MLSLLLKVLWHASGVSSQEEAFKSPSPEALTRELSGSTFWVFLLKVRQKKGRVSRKLPFLNVFLLLNCRHLIALLIRLTRLAT